MIPVPPARPRRAPPRELAHVPSGRPRFRTNAGRDAAARGAVLTRFAYAPRRNLVNGSSESGDPSPAEIGSVSSVNEDRLVIPDAVVLTRIMLLQDSSPRFLVDHCHCSLELALLIAASGADLDVEVLQVGMLLPDLVLTPRFHSPAPLFAVASADAARDLVRAHGMDPRPGRQGVGCGGRSHQRAQRLRAEAVRKEGEAGARETRSMTVHIGRQGLWLSTR